MNKIDKKPYGYNGYISFNKLFDVLEKKGLNKQYLRNNGIHSNTVVKLSNNENVSCEVIANLCSLLDVQPKQILEYIPDKKRVVKDKHKIDLPDCFK